MNDLTVYQQHGQQHHAKAVHYARYYTLEQLKQFYSTASIGFICASFASWCLMSFFIGQFFAGSEFEYMHEWRGIQYLYAGMGMALATAITIAEAVLFNSGRAREYMAVVIFAVGFSVFAESAATMQREQSTVAFKSTQSEVYKATIQAINVLSTTSTLTPAQVQLSGLQSSYEQAKQAGNKSAMEAIQGRISRAENRAELEQANRSMALRDTIGQAKDLEYDETKHQAMIRFMAEVFGLSHVVSSALLAFFLVLTFKVCFHYLGLMRQLNDRAISVRTGKLSVVIDQGSSPALTGQASPLFAASNPSLQLTVGEFDNSGNSTVYAIAEAAKVGEVVSCPNCGQTFQKANKWHLFCSNSRKPRADGGNCSDDYHNAQDPDRAAHAKRRKG